MTISFNATTATTGAELFIPLNKLKKSPANARKVPHSPEMIEALAASIAAKGMLQNLVVEPERDAEGAETGFYLVTIGEGRRQAQVLRAKRKEIRKTEPVRCVLDTANDPQEISLDENVTREAMHPADQFERFRELSERKGWGAEDIAARFGVTPHVVRQRLRLGAVSPKLMAVYREGGLGLEQMMAFAISDDQVRQIEVYEALSWNKEPHIIRRMMTETKVRADNGRVRFVGLDAYQAAGGTILRDLFTDDDGGYCEDAALLDRLAVGKLDGIAAEVRAEGWKWVEAYLDYPHAHGLRRVYPHDAPLSEDDQAALESLQAEYSGLSEQYDGEEEVPEDIETRLSVLEAEIDRIEAKERVYDPEDIARAGVLVSLSYDGTPRIDRGLIRAEDGAESVDGDQGGDADGSTREQGNGTKPLPDSLIADLTAHRTLALRVTLGEQADVALIAVTHALAVKAFYLYRVDTCLGIAATSESLKTHAEGIEETAAARTLEERHRAWEARLPNETADLWDFVAGLSADDRMKLLAHCASLSVNAVTGSRTGEDRAAADQLAKALSLDMTAHWAPTARSYLGRVTKAHIQDAVRDAVDEDAARRLEDMKKPAMAEAAERLLAGTGWLPAVLRTPAAPQAEEPESYSIAAE